MKTIFEFREKVIQLYHKVDAFIVPVLKLFVAFIVFHTINARLGYFTKISSVPIELIASLLCSFLPAGVIVIIASVFVLLHMYSLSIIAAVLCGMLFLALYLLLLRFANKESVVAAIAPVLMYWRMPCILPLILGASCTPGAAVAAACGIVAYCFIKVITTNAVAISNMGIGEAADQLKLIVDAFLANKGMIVVIIAFAATITAVFLLRRLPIKRNWEIALGAGAVLEIVILIVGDIIIDTGLNFGVIILTTILSAAIAFGIKFFRFCVDFGRTERVQFEDDDYYYYVKAVPKINLGIAAPKSKSINRQKSGRGRFVTGGTEDDIYDDGIYEDENYEDEEFYEENYSDEEQFDENFEEFNENTEVYSDEESFESDEYYEGEIDAEGDEELPEDLEELF